MNASLDKPLKNEDVMTIAGQRGNAKLTFESITIPGIAYWLCLILVFVCSTRDFLNALFPSLPLALCMYAVSALVIFAGVLSLRSANPYALSCIVLVELIAAASFACSPSLVQKDYIAGMFFDVSSLLNTFAYLIAFARMEKPERLRRHLLVLAIVCMAIIIVATLSGRYASEDRELNYLGVGIGSVVWICYLTQSAFVDSGKPRVVSIVASVASIGFVAVYGNRGSLVAVMAFLVFCLVRYTNMKRKALIATLLAVAVALFSVFGDVLYSTLISFVNDLGIYSRNLTLSLSDSLLTSTNRDSIWAQCMERLDGHWLTGYGLAYDRVIGGASNVYAHNMLIELWLIFGLIPGSLLFLAHIVIGVKMCFSRTDTDWSRLYAPFFIASTVLLMFNSSFLILPIFWGGYGLLFAYGRSKSLESN